MQIESIHHVSLNVTDLERSKRFYSEILGLEEIERPPFDFPGAWFAAGVAQHVHLIVHHGATFRGHKGIDTRENHFAIRVASYSATVEFLRGKGYREAGDELDLKSMRLQPHATAGFPQIYILDPDRHVIEINAAALS
ncbi:MAG: VOC family protein [Bryobacterales bacterium]|nr:VOC family protein [Bryobacterales bacterium]